MEFLVLGAYLQDGQAWTVAWKCLIPNNYSFLNISLSPTGNFWWFHCVSLWNSKPSWLQKIRKQLHSKPDFLLSLDCLGIIVQLYVVRKLRKFGFQISLCFPVSQIWKVWCHFWIFYFANLLLKYETPVPYTKQIGVEIKGMFGANLKLYRYPHTKFGETIHILLPLPVGTDCDTRIWSFPDDWKQLAWNFARYVLCQILQNHLLNTYFPTSKSIFTE